MVIYVKNPETYRHRGLLEVTFGLLGGRNSENMVEFNILKTRKRLKYGSNTIKLRVALGGGTLRNHSSFVDLLSLWLARAPVPHRGGKQGKPQTCKNLLSRVSRHRFGAEGGKALQNMNHAPPSGGGAEEKALQEITSNYMTDGCFLSTTLDGVGGGLLRGTRTLADVKTKSCDDRYPAEGSGSACAIVIKRQQEVNEKVPQEGRRTRYRAGSIPERTQR